MFIFIFFQCKWLFHPNNKLGVKERMDTDVEELDIATAKLILLGMNKDSPDLAKCLTSMKRRLRVFLVEVIPDPEPDDLDLVSGYCHSGCRQVFLYSKIHWQEVGSYNIPLCPDCIQIQQEKQLELIFMLELHVFDANGLHSTILVCREHAENFMNGVVIDIKSLRESYFIPNDLYEEHREDMGK
ncbi:hypothetical protein J6590_018017 [Homalodisca vitripennis]|nr:hypothetical protein J6590_018017 [Homalodisca vitripennis]